MRTDGYISPQTEESARAHFAALGPAAQELTREIAVAMEFSQEEYRERVTTGVVSTAREALFGSLLEVTTADRDTFDTWLAEQSISSDTVTIEGGELVEYIAWHQSPMAGRVIGATYQHEREAAVSTLRRMAWGKLYRPVIIDE